tara:strand:+ start:18508 stop:19404 length:897 start_codon:yes stop_codon:yes gene_type:complete
METADIKLIRTIAEHGSLTRAAESLHLSQPTLSKKLARLESQLNSRLFYRSPTGVVATEIARYIVASSHSIQAQIMRIERHVEQLSELATGEIRLGVGPIIEQVLLPELALRFVELTGNVRLSIFTDHAEKLLARLHSADLDVIAGPFRASEHPDLAGFPLVQDSFATVARAGHPIFHDKDGVDIKSFAIASPVPEGAVTGGALAQSVSPKQIICDNYALLKNLTINSDCICRAPLYVFREELGSGSLREIKTDNTLTWESACLVRPESVETPLVKLILNLFSEGGQRYAQRDVNESP